MIDIIASKTFFKLTSIIFLLIALLHLSRLLFGWTAVIAGWEVPMWISVVGVLLAGFLSYSAFKLGSAK